MDDPDVASVVPRTSVAEIAALFLKLGVTSFGGPAVHIAMMEDEVVTRRRWLSRDQFLDLVGATNLIPGPNSTEMAIHIGHLRAGWPGLLVAGISFVLPATLIVGALAWAYVRFGSLPQTSGILYGVKPVVIAIILQALWRLGRTAVKSWMLAGLAAAASIVALAGVDEIAILAGAGAAVALARHASARAAGGALLLPFAQAGVAAGGPAALTLWPLFLFFLKVGAILFGSGYVLIAFLHTGLVLERGWLTESQLLDAVAIGQVTPGPLSTTATFVGYILAGIPGATVATVGMFVPAFVFVALSAPLVSRIRRSAGAGSVLDGVNVASLALMAVATMRLATTAIVDVPTLLLALASALLIVWLRVHSGWVVVGAAVAGVIASQGSG